MRRLRTLYDPLLAVPATSAADNDVIKLSPGLANGDQMNRNYTQQEYRDALAQSRPTRTNTTDCPASLSARPARQAGASRRQ